MDVFEDKESTDTGSLAESESPPMSSGGGADGGGVVPQVMNIAVNMSVEKTLGVSPASGGGVGGGGDGGGVVASGVLMNSDLTNTSGKKKRGRPRKYDSEGNLRAPYVAAAAAAAAAGGGSSPSGFTLTTSPSSGFSSSGKRGRGRPSGSSGNWQIFASLGEIFASTAGGDFTPHVVTVYAGEDVAGKILSFVQKGSRGMCVLSANGSVSNVTIRQPGSSDGLLTYEGRFEILSLTGSYTTTENGGIKSRTGGLSVSLAGPDGRVIGGGVAGMLMAASPIQIVVGSFMPNGYVQKTKRKYNTEPKMAAPAPIHSSPDPVSVGRPSQAAPENNVYSTQPSFPSQPEAGDSLSNKNTTNSTATNTNTGNWNGSVASFDQRTSPDINLSIEQQ